MSKQKKQNTFRSADEVFRHYGLIVECPHCHKDVEGEARISGWCPHCNRRLDQKPVSECARQIAEELQELVRKRREAAS